jgi:Ti-type conjugative transfer relaxase TraA
LAIYHLHAKIVSRGKGQSVVASAAYRAGASLYDERLGQVWDYTRKRGVEHTEILTPYGAPEWVRDRERLWNEVERVERRKDAQLAREIEIALPVELTKDQQIALMRDFSQRAFVAKGMVADFALHLDNPQNPHAHLLLTTRDLTPEGFGLKRRDWNAKTELLTWRQQWAEIGNEHLARAGLDLHIDHRSLEAQGIYLVAGRKLGLSAERQQQPALPPNLAERVAEQRAIAAENGRRIIKDPTLALGALTHMQATFTLRDIGKYLHTHTDGAEQFDTAYLKVTTSTELVPLGTDEQGRARFTTREMLEVEHQMLQRAHRLASTADHTVSDAHQKQALADSKLSLQQQEAFEHVTGPSDLTALVGVAGAGKSRRLGSARLAWEAGGYTVKGAALAGIAAENLEVESGITSRTLASWELAWSTGRDLLTRQDVLVIDEAGLVGTRQLARVLESAAKAGAKVVLVGDPEQLQAIEAGAAFRGIAAQTGVAEITEVRRQKLDWQKEATQQLATGRTIEALEAYEHDQAIQAVPTKEGARKALLAAWREAEAHHPDETRLILAYTRDEVRQLNAQARELRQAAGELGHSEAIQTERGAREFAAGDRLYFLKNERSLGVKNGSLGTVEKIEHGILQVRMDGEEDRRVAVDSRYYSHLDHGYATTVHKSQGATVDRTFVLATPHFDRHTTYVALSRHRQAATVVYAAEDFGAAPETDRPASSTEIRDRFHAVLSRARAKELAHDFLDPNLLLPDRLAQKEPRTWADIDAVQQNAAERWLAKQHARKSALSADKELTSSQSRELDHDATSNALRPRTQRQSYQGPEDDLDV